MFNGSRVIWFINLVFTAIVTHQAVSLFYDFMAPKPLSIPQVLAEPKMNTQASKTVDHPLRYYQPIIKRNLFRANPLQQKPSSAVALADESINDTDLELRLWGTIVSQQGPSYAVIEDFHSKKNDLKQRLYQTGDHVQDAEILQVFREKVLLLSQGEKQYLHMEEFEDHYGRRRYRRRRQAKLTYPRSIRRSQIENAMQNLHQLMRGIRVKRHPEGILLARVSRNSILNKIGLRQGDIILSVDGEKIRNTRQAMSLYRRLKNAESLKLDLRRNHRIHSIHYKVR